MFLKKQRAFSMFELIFVIVIIGILMSVALPRLMTTRDDAMIVKAKTTIAAVRGAMARERQKRILEGNATSIKRVDSGKADQPNKLIFDKFDGSITTSEVLEYPLITCVDKHAKGCWIRKGENYIYRMPSSQEVHFSIKNNRFICDDTSLTSNCILLTQ